MYTSEPRKEDRGPVTKEESGMVRNGELGQVGKLGGYEGKVYEFNDGEPCL